MDWLGWTGLVVAALVVPTVGFALALRQDNIRWARERRAELYIDLLAQAHADKAMMQSRLARWEAEAKGEDPGDGEQPADPMDPKTRAMLEARMAAFSTAAVRRAFVEMYTPFLGQGAVDLGNYKRRSGEIDDAILRLQTRIRRELGTAGD